VLRTKQRTTADGAAVGDEERAHSYRWVRGETMLFFAHTRRGDEDLLW
jgi:hypothetical protein